MQTEHHHDNIRRQFAQRIDTYERAATWMLSPALIEAQREVVGRAQAGRDLCLDLCCGTGIVGRNLLDLGWQVKGLDLTPEMGWVASQYFPVKIGSIENIELPDNTYDLAILRQAFMLVNGKKALAEIHRVLKPGGRFVLIQSVSFSGDDDRVYEEVQRARHINLVSYYREADLISSLTEAGFRVAGRKQLAVRESVDRWLNSAPELKPELRARIRGLISGATDAYKRARDVRTEGGELFENWNWLLITGEKVG
jgi:ubiquinone/menaquinone biosynthesis C-methylase UbiE